MNTITGNFIRCFDANSWFAFSTLPITLFIKDLLEQLVAMQLRGLGCRKLQH